MNLLQAVGRHTNYDPVTEERLEKRCRPNQEARRFRRSIGDDAIGRLELRTGGQFSYRLYRKMANATKAIVTTQRTIFLVLLLFSSAIAEVHHT